MLILGFSFLVCIYIYFRRCLPILLIKNRKTGLPSRTICQAFYCHSDYYLVDSVTSCLGFVLPRNMYICVYVYHYLYNSKTKLNNILNILFTQQNPHTHSYTLTPCISSHGLYYTSIHIY